MVGLIGPKEKEKQLYDKCFDRYCTELSYDKNHSKAKVISLDMVSLKLRIPIMNYLNYENKNRQIYSTNIVWYNFH